MVNSVHHIIKFSCELQNNKQFADVGTKLSWIMELMVQVRNHRRVNRCDDYRACVDGLFVESNRLVVKMVGIHEMPYKRYKGKHHLKEVEAYKRAMGAWSVGVCVYYIVALQ